MKLYVVTIIQIEGEGFILHQAVHADQEAATLAVIDEYNATMKEVFDSAGCEWEDVDTNSFPINANYGHFELHINKHEVQL